MPRRPTHRPTVARWRRVMEALHLTLAHGAELRVTPESAADTVELALPGEGRARAWELVDGQWTELTLSASEQDDHLTVWRVAPDDAERLMGELLAGHPLELSWGARAGAERGSVSGAANFVAALHTLRPRR